MLDSSVLALPADGTSLSRFVLDDGFGDIQPVDAVDHVLDDLRCLALGEL